MIKVFLYCTGGKMTSESPSNRILSGQHWRMEDYSPLNRENSTGATPSHSAPFQRGYNYLLLPRKVYKVRHMSYINMVSGQV